jgi:hypothetical protein
VNDLDTLSGADGVSTASSVVRSSAVLASLLNVIRIAGNVTAQWTTISCVSTYADCCRVVRNQGRAFYQAILAIVASDGLKLGLAGSRIIGLTTQRIVTSTSELIDNISHISSIRGRPGCLA